MSKTEQYVSRYLEKELLDIVNSKRNEDTPGLTSFEKAIIYKYSNDGYESLNQALRKGLSNSEHEFGSLLAAALDKLDSYSGLVYRNVNLAFKEIEFYREALNQNQLVTEYPFISTSRSVLVANSYNGNVLFKIYSKSGKNIEKISKFGIYGAQNEKEVLFKPFTTFEVLEIEVIATQTQIIMEEF